MRFLIAGATGFLGTALRRHLAEHGHAVTRLTRRPPASPDEAQWDPARGAIDQRVVDDADVVVNLAGASFYRWPMTESYKAAFRASRVDTTRLLAEAIARSPGKPTFLAQNGTSWYGDRGDEVLTEDSPARTDGTFLNGITKDWQAATDPAAQAGARVCILHTSAVLDRSGGAFQLLRLIFLTGAGGPAGAGDQYFSTITLRDWVRAVLFLAEHEECSGRYNLVGPEPVTNADFVHELGRQLHRPTVLRVPEWPMRRLLPELSPELFSSVRAVPHRLEEAGFRFDHPTNASRIAAALSPS